MPSSARNCGGALEGDMKLHPGCDFRVFACRDLCSIHLKRVWRRERGLVWITRSRLPVSSSLLGNRAWEPSRGWVLNTLRLRCLESRAESTPCFVCAERKRSGVSSVGKVSILAPFPLWVRRAAMAGTLSDPLKLCIVSRFPES
jgi:hypothetical protein